ncbi:MAG: DUF4364 family protein [Ruminococcaceae bacterium]|nr:DUF4364 family protein [Oscillospiraceae bacterium]
MAYTREIDDFVMIQYIILYTMAKADRHMTYTQLNGLILGNLNIDFSTYQLALDNLEQIGQLYKFSFDELTTFYELLPEGKEANGFFEKEIPIYIREQIDEAIPPFFHEEEKKRSIRAELSPINPREFGAELGIYDKNLPLMNLFIYAGEREDANRMMKRFRENPEELYQRIVSFLMEEEKKDGENAENPLTSEP